MSFVRFSSNSRNFINTRLKFLVPLSICAFVLSMGYFGHINNIFLMKKTFKAEEGYITALKTLNIFVMTYAYMTP